MASDRLIVFTRYPEPGRTKTRLIAKLGAAGAAGLQREMTIHTLATAQGLAGSRSKSGSSAATRPRCAGPSAAG